VNLGQYSQAIDTLEETKELDTYGKYLYSKALFLNGEFERALIETQKLKEASSFDGLNADEAQELKQHLEVLSRKVQMEVTNQEKIGTINDAAYLSSQKTAKANPVTEAAPVKSAPSPIDKKYDWYQNPSYVFISYKVSSPEVSQEAEVTFEDSAVNITYKDQTIRLELTNQIVPEESAKQATAKKIELKLKKSLENVNWMGVEKGGEAKLLATAIPTPGAEIKPSYPTSSKNKKNWDSIDKEIKKQEAEDKPEGDSALNALFK
jgi:suppressor of G2 allele of SKP1